MASSSQVGSSRAESPAGRAARSREGVLPEVSVSLRVARARSSHTRLLLLRLVGIEEVPSARVERQGTGSQHHDDQRRDRERRGRGPDGAWADRRAAVAARSPVQTALQTNRAKRVSERMKRC